MPGSNTLVFATHTLSPKGFLLQLAMAEVAKHQGLQIRRCETGGSEIWVWGEPKDGECWAQGWHSPQPVAAWWTTEANEWTLIGHKLMDVETRIAKKSFFAHPNGWNFVDSDGNETKYTHSRLSSEVSSKGGKGPNFVKIQKTGKGLDDEPKKKKAPFGA